MMKNFLLSVLTGMMVLIMNSGVFAADYVHTYNPTPGDLNDLDHYKAYSWKIDATEIINNNETIIGASLYFNGIYDWTSESNKLHVSLLDGSSISSGVQTYTDDQVTSNFFDQVQYNSELLFRIENMGTQARNIKIDITDLDVEYNSFLKNELSWVEENPNLLDGTKINMPVEGLTNLIAYAADGIFGLGFDPDCHFWNNGITLKLYTTSNDTPGNTVPEPATLMLFGAGLLGLAAKMRKKSRIA